MFKKGDLASSLVIIKSGTLDLITQIDGEDVTMAQLGSGSVLNSRTVFFEEETMQVDVKCS